MITRENYESYFIDLLDGTLSTEEVDLLLDFMRANPDLANELKNLEQIKLKPDTTEQFNHSHLIKSEIEKDGVLEETCIRSLENELSPSEAVKFQSYIAKNAQAKNEYRLYQATLSEPNPFIVYENKESLKRRSGIIPFWYSVAAVLVLGLMFWFTFPGEPTYDTIAQVIPLSVNPPATEINTAQLQNSFQPIIEKRAEYKPAEKSALPEEPKLVRTAHRIPILNTRSAEKLPAIALTMDFALSKMPSNARTSSPYYPTVPELLAEEVNKIDPKKGVQVAGRFALNKLKDFTDEKLNFTTNSNGNVSHIAYNSKLLAFSIPMNSKNN